MSVLLIFSAIGFVQARLIHYGAFEMNNSMTIAFSCDTFTGVSERWWKWACHSIDSRAPDAISKLKSLGPCQTLPPFLSFYFVFLSGVFFSYFFSFLFLIFWSHSLSSTPQPSTLKTFDTSFQQDNWIDWSRLFFIPSWSDWK